MSRSHGQPTWLQGQRLQMPAAPTDGTQELEAAPHDEALHDGLPARPLIALVAAIHQRTGDSVATIAKGLSVDQRWLRSVLAGRTPTVDTTRGTAVCNALRFSPLELWDRADVIRAFDGHGRRPPDIAAEEPLLRQDGAGEPPELVW